MSRPVSFIPATHSRRVLRLPTPNKPAISQDKGTFERRSVISVIIISIGYFGFSQTSMD